MSTDINRIITDVGSAQIVIPRTARTNNLALGRISETADIVVTCFDNEVPEFVDAELDRLYGHFYCSILHFKSSGKIANASTYVERFENNVMSLILFRRKKSIVTVLNEVVAISDREIERFSHYIFRKFSDVTVVMFTAIGTNLQRRPFTVQRFNCLEDIVVSLPANMPDYLASLGTNLRRNLKRRKRELLRDYPDASFKIYTDDEVNKDDIHDVVALNRERMSNKNKVSLIDTREADSLVANLKQSGLACIITIDHRVCAGATCIRNGNNYFLTVIAHDSKYDVYSLGILCCAHLIHECIDRGGREFHFLWGRYDYKYALNGVQRDLDQVVIYRSPLHFLLNAKLALKIWKKAKRRQASLWLQNQKKSDDAMSRFAMQIFYRIRGMWK